MLDLCIPRPKDELLTGTNAARYSRPSRRYGTGAHGRSDIAENETYERNGVDVSAGSSSCPTADFTLRHHLLC